MKFSGKNFQPWPEFDLDISGLTIVIGPSNEGKSSLYRALRGLLRNELDAAYIRNPKDKPLELTLRHKDYTIAASRSNKGSVHYTVSHPDFAEPKLYSKLDGDVPDEIKGFKFDEIRIGSFTFDPIFASQNRPQFLIDNDSFKPMEINALFGAFGGTEKLEAGKKQANLQKTQKDGEARVLAGQIRYAEERKAKLEGMSAEADRIGVMLAGSETAINQLGAEAHWLSEAIHRLRRLAPLQHFSAALAIPDASEIEPLQHLGICAEQAALSGRFAKWMRKPLQTIEEATGGWNAALALWRQIKALGEAAELLFGQTDISELTAFQTEIPATELNCLQGSITLLEHTIALRRELKETAGKLAETDGQLSVEQSVLVSEQKILHDAELEAERLRIEESTSRGLCHKCGKPLEHVCRVK